MIQREDRARADRRLPQLGPRGEGWFLLQVLLIAAIFAAGLLAGGQLSGAARLVAALAGVIIMATGAALGLLAMRDLDRSMSPFPRPTEQAGLVTRGIYARLRHPMYTAVMLTAVGWSVLAASPLALGLSVVLILLLDLKARREEVWLHERFSAYADYATRTRRFVPGIY